MDYFAGLDITMDETHVCVLDREGVVVREGKAESTAQAVANELSKAPSCRRIVFETGRMAPILFHGLSQLGLPVVCVESRQAYQALKSLATHKTDRNDARGLAHLARADQRETIGPKPSRFDLQILRRVDLERQQSLNELTVHLTGRHAGEQIHRSLGE